MCDIIITETRTKGEAQKQEVTNMLKITRASMLKVQDGNTVFYQVFDDGELVAKFYNKADAKEWVDMLNKMHVAK
jgi:rhamnogalacturonyl hydrolase YesR